jgi:CBS domain-containing protein
MGLPFEGRNGPETRAGAAARRDVPTLAIDDDPAGVELGVVVDADGIVLALVEGGELHPGPSTFRPSVPKTELAAYLDDHDVPRTLITTLDGRLVGVVDRGDL